MSVIRLELTRARALLRESAFILKDVGLTCADLEVLSVAVDNPGLPLSGVAERADLGQAGVRQIVTRLEKAGLVHLTLADHLGKYKNPIRLLRATDKGERTYRKAHRALEGSSSSQTRVA